MLESLLKYKSFFRSFKQVILKKQVILRLFFFFKSSTFEKYVTLLSETIIHYGSNCQMSPQSDSRAT